jgi:hypothetical protein
MDAKEKKLVNAYNRASGKLESLRRAGVPVTDPRVAAAVRAVQNANKALTEYRGGKKS